MKMNFPPMRNILLNYTTNDTGWYSYCDSFGEKQSHVHNSEILLEVSITRCDYTSLPVRWMA